MKLADFTRSQAQLVLWEPSPTLPRLPPELRHCMVLDAQRNKVVGLEEARTFDCTSGARTKCVTSYQLPALDPNFLPVIGARSEPITATCYTRTSLTRDSQE